MSQDISETIKSLENEREELLNKADQILATINILKISHGLSNGTISLSKNSSFKHLDNAYNSNMTLKAKVAYFIKKEQRFLHNREMANMAHEREPEVSVKEFVSKFSAVLSILKREGILVNFSIDNINRNTFWGSPKWLDENGNIRQEFMYDESQVKKVGEQEIDI